jgi:hypothetical protein
MSRWVVITCLALCVTLWGDWQVEQLDADFAPFEQGIPAIDLRQWGDREGYVYVRIRDGTVHYRATVTHSACVPRLPIVIAALRKVASQGDLPDLECVLSVWDSLVAHEQGPILCFAKKKEEQGVLMPDFEMLSGYRGNFYDTLMANAPQWSALVPKVLFRGASTGGVFRPDNWMNLPRPRACLLAKSIPEILDAKLIKACDCDPQVQDIMIDAGIIASYMPVADQLRYKYQLDIDGNSCCYSRTYWILRSNCVPFKVQSNNIQWFYKGIHPYIHYVPIASDFSDLADNYFLCEAHEEMAQAIAQAGHLFAMEELNPEAAHAYLHRVLLRYASLLR